MKLRGGNFHAATTSQDMLYWKYGCKRNITLLPSSSNILPVNVLETLRKCTWGSLLLKAPSINPSRLDWVSLLSIGLLITSIFIPFKQWLKIAL